MNGNEVKLWVYREGDESGAVLNNKVDFLRHHALENQINISENKLKTLARGLLALEAEDIQLPPNKMLEYEARALYAASQSPESDILTVVLVAQQRIIALYRL